MQVAEISLVAIYHWIERTCKWKLGWRPKQPKDIGGLNWCGLVKAFEKNEAPLQAHTNYAKVNTLRLFANSWKHQVEWASEDLRSELKLSGVHRHLDDHELVTALAANLCIALSEDVPAVDVVEGAVTLAMEFLVEVLA